MKPSLYPYGLRIATLSSKKLGDSYEGHLKNSYLYNDKELFDDADLNWYDYGFRYYDPQIGRFPQLDPLTFSYPFYTPYQYAGCEPIANVDVDGLEPSNVLQFMKGLEKAGASNITVKLVQSGKNAGMFSVAWGKGGVIFARVFKTTQSATQAVGTIIGGIAKAAQATNILVQTNHSSCHKPGDQYLNRFSFPWGSAENYDGNPMYSNQGSGSRGDVWVRKGKNPGPPIDVTMFIAIAQTTAPGVSNLNLGSAESKLAQGMESLAEQAKNAEGWNDAKEEYKKLKTESELKETYETQTNNVAEEAQSNTQSRSIKIDPDKVFYPYPPNGKGYIDHWGEDSNYADKKWREYREKHPNTKFYPPEPRKHSDTKLIPAPRKKGK